MARRASVFLSLVLCLAIVYLVAARRGSKNDRRGRRWPSRYTVSFLSALAVLVVDLYGGIGTTADARLSAHMVEHMVMWLIVAPLLAASAPVRLSFFALGRDDRHRLARWLHTPALSVISGPVGSVSLFSAVLVIGHLPAVYQLTLNNDYAHEAEHGMYLLTAVIMWAPIIGVDPLPHRPGPRGRAACMVACMVPMALIAAWLATATAPVYGHYLDANATAAINDQHLAAAIMLCAGLPAFAVPALLTGRGSRRRRPSPPDQRTTAPAQGLRTITPLSVATVRQLADHLGRYGRGHARRTRA